MEAQAFIRTVGAHAFRRGKQGLKFAAALAAVPKRRGVQLAVVTNKMRFFTERRQQISANPQRLKAFFRLSIAPTPEGVGFHGRGEELFQ